MLLVGHALAVVVAAAVVVMITVVVLAVPMGVCSTAPHRRPHSVTEDDDAHGDDEQRRHEVHPRVQVFRDDELRQRERRDAGERKRTTSCPTCAGKALANATTEESSAVPTQERA